MATDGAHTATEVERQLSFMRATRGTGQHAQLIGAEVSLLAPDDHARALEIMREHGRKPISMTHGDFDYEYLRRPAVAPDGRRRFDLLRVATHVDVLMLGQRSVPHPRAEADLDAERRRIVAMFDRLRAEYGVRSDLPHTWATPGAGARHRRPDRGDRDGHRLCGHLPAARPRRSDRRGVRGGGALHRRPARRPGRARARVDQTAAVRARQPTRRLRAGKRR